jgi:hypothetical protein
VIAVVHARGAGEWVSVDASDIADLWLWLELLDERGVAIRSPLPLHLPPRLSVLATRIAGNDRLPRARIVT